MTGSPRRFIFLQASHTPRKISVNQMKAGRDRFVVVYRTGKLQELEMARVALQEARIPCYSQEEHLGRLKLAMPVTTAQGPGVWWSIHVSESSFEAAKQILQELPIDYQLYPKFWAHAPSAKTKNGYKLYAGIMVVVTMAMLLYYFIRNIMEL